MVDIVRMMQTLENTYIVTEAWTVHANLLFILFFVLGVSILAWQMSSPLR
uniref:Uncharacterized protein n=1 Tax=Arundo donax TaxID=35708 RepID=A0A0A9G7Q7_ARUDO